MFKLPPLLTLSLLLPLASCVVDPGPYVEDEVPDTISLDDEEDDDVDAPIPGDEVVPDLPLAVVLAHGFGGSAESFAPEIEAALVGDGHSVLRASVRSVDSVANRATDLGAEVDAFLAQTGTEKVHLIAHSMGGLDARYLISSLGYSDRVASLTTISTPHWGTPLADLALDLVGETDDQNAALELLEALAGDVDSDALERALYDLSETRAASFNAANVDAVGVQYHSYAGLSTVFGASVSDAELACLTQPGTVIPEPDALAAPLVLTGPLVATSDGGREAQDGVVAVRSATFGDFRGCIPADHFDEILYRTDTDFDSVQFYRRIVAELVSP